MRVDERFDLSSDRFITFAGVVQERVAICQVQGERRLKEFIYLLPASSIHRANYTIANPDLVISLSKNFSME